MKHLAIFGKYWQAGRVKTRLAKSLGDQPASRLYRIFLETLLRRFATVGDRRWLVFTPDTREQEFCELAQGRWEVMPQSSGDLGERMQTFFHHALAAGAHQVVLIGSDSPSLPIAFVEQAFAQLERFPVVLGPSADGGFYLIGTTQALSPTLEGIPWSTADVLRCTIDRLEQTGTPCYHLPRWYDVDEHQHLVQLDHELRELEELPDELRDLAAAVQQALGRGSEEGVKE